MKFRNKFMSLVLVGIMTMAVCVPALAADNTVTAANGTGSVPVELTAEAATFSVLVPTSMPINVAADGTVTTASDAKIVNNSHGAVKVTAMTVAGTNGWATADFDTFDPGAVAVGTKTAAMTINGDKTTGADAISFTQANFPVLAGKNDTTSDELPITYTAKVAAQATALSGQAVANVVFTVGWNTPAAA